MEVAVRVLGLALAAIAVGMLVATTRRPGNLPGWHWAVAGYVMFDITLLYYRVRSLTLGAPLNLGDIGFVLANVFVIVAFVIRSRKETA